MGKTIRELLNEAKLAGHKSITREEVLEEKAAIEQGFVALGLTVEEGLRRVCAHEYYHDGGPFDLLAERYIVNQAWLRVMNETADEEVCDEIEATGGAWSQLSPERQAEIRAQAHANKQRDDRPTIRSGDESISGPVLPGHSENHVVHWSGSTIAAPGLPRSSDPNEVTCGSCKQQALGIPRPPNPMDDLLAQIGEGITREELEQRRDILLARYAEFHGLMSWEAIRAAIRTHALPEDDLFEEWMEIRAFLELVHE